MRPTIKGQLKFNKSWVVVVVVSLIASPVASIAGCKTKNNTVGFNSSAAARSYYDALLKNDTETSKQLVLGEGALVPKDLPIILVTPLDKAAGGVAFVKVIGLAVEFWLLDFMIDCR